MEENGGIQCLVPERDRKCNKVSLKVKAKCRATDENYDKQLFTASLCSSNSLNEATDFSLRHITIVLPNVFITFKTSIKSSCISFQYYSLLDFLVQ